MLERGDRVLHISVRRIDGTPFTYRDLWQRRNLLLVCLAGPGDPEREAAYLAGLGAQAGAFEACEATVVVTRAPVAGLPSPAVLIADRWGEIVAVEPARDGEFLPPVGELLEWLRFVVHACPECEGEAR